MELISGSCMISLFFYASRRIANGTLTPGQFISFLAALAAVEMRPGGILRSFGVFAPQDDGTQESQEFVPPTSVTFTASPRHGFSDGDFS